MKRHLVVIVFALAAFASVSLTTLDSQRGVSFGAPTARASIGSWFKKAGQNIKKGFKKVGTAFKDFGKKVKKGFDKAGKVIKKGFDKAGKAIKKGFDKAGKWIKKNIGNVACQAAGPLCTIPKFIAGYKKNMKEAKAYMGKRLSNITDKFKKVLNLDDFKQFPKACLKDLTGSIVKNLGEVIAKFNSIVGIPFPIDKLAAFGVSAALGGISMTGFCPMAAIHLGMKKLLGWAIPKLILGVGAAYNSASTNKHAKNFGKIAEFVLKAVGAVGGGLGVIGELLGGKGKKFTQRIQEVMRKIANVSGRMQKGLDASLKVAGAVATGEFTTIEAALAKAPVISSELSAEDLGKMVDGLKDMAAEQIWGILQKPLRKLISKATALLGKLLDIPRNALVAAVGTIPFAGGVLAASLNFLLGVGVDFIFNFLAEQVEKMVQGILKDQVLEPIAVALKKELTKSKGNVKAAEGVVKLVKTMAALAGDVTKSLEQAGSGFQGTFKALAATALEKVLLRGVGHAGLRKLLSTAIASIIGDVASRKVGLADGIARVLKSVAPQLPALVASQIKDAKVRAAVQAGLSAVVKTLAAANVRKLSSGAVGLFRALATQAFEAAKDALRDVLVARGLGNVEAALSSVGKAVSEDGISALLRLDRYLPTK